MNPEPRKKLEKYRMVPTFSTISARENTFRLIYRYLWMIAATVSLVYGVIFLLNSFGVEFLLPVRGRGIVKFFVEIELFGREIDFAVFSASLLLVSSAFFPFFRRQMPLKASQLLLVLPLGLILLAVVEVGSVAKWVTAGFVVGAPFADSSWNISLLEMKLANVFYPWAPRILLLFLFSWLLRSLLRLHENSLVRLFSRIRLGVSNPDDNRSVANRGGRMTHLPPKILLTTGLLLAVFIAAYPYFPAVNGAGRLIGVDTPFYLKNLELAGNSTVPGVISVSLSDDRTILHLLNYFLYYLIQDAALVMKILPAILSLLLVLSTFAFVRVGTGDSYLSGLSALFTPLAFQQIVGMNAGFYANWLALVQANFFFAFLLKALRDKRFSAFLGSLTISGLILFTHPWTWFVVMFSLSIFLVVGLLTKSSGRRESSLILTVLAVNILADAVKGAAFSSVPSGVQTAYGSLIPSFMIADIPNILRALQATFNTFLGGALYNIPLLLLATLGFLAITSYRSHFNRVLLSLGVVGLMGVLLFSSNFLDYLQARAVYVIPFAVFGALGFTAVTRFFRKVGLTLGVSDLYLSLFNLALGISVTASMLNHTLRMASMIYPFMA